MSIEMKNIFSPFVYHMIHTLPLTKPGFDVECYREFAMDALMLARVQFAMTAGFHFIFPSLTIGLACSLAVLEGIGYFGRNEDFKKISLYVSRFFIITFAAGVGTGIVMALQFGTNWSRFTTIVNDIFGIFLVAEVVLSFFMESFFAGLYIFGRGRIKPFLHWLSIVLVAAGTLISSFWILTANSWMHSPSGFQITGDGKFILSDFGKAVFNPSMLPRFFHTVNSTMIASAFFLTGLCAYMILNNKSVALAKKLIGGAVLFAAVTSLMELFPFGHMQIVSVAQIQKAKFATIEGVNTTSDDPPILLLGIPDPSDGIIKHRLEIPHMMKYLFLSPGKHTVTGLDSIPGNEKPPMVMPFVTFHLMVYLGCFLILLSVSALALLMMKRLYDNKWFLRILVWAIPLPVIIIELGWMTTEIGRQPWIIQGLLRTEDAVSFVSAGQILFSIILIGVTELALIVLWLSLMINTLKKGPEGVEGHGEYL
jgi:cytochrome d ubiquinol oxidase subunit I